MPQRITPNHAARVRPRNSFKRVRIPRLAHGSEHILRDAPRPVRVTAPYMDAIPTLDHRLSAGSRRQLQLVRVALERPITSDFNLLVRVRCDAKAETTEQCAEEVVRRRARNRRLARRHEF